MAGAARLEVVKSSIRTRLHWRIDTRARFPYSQVVSDATRILDRVQQGDAKAAGELIPLVYDELRRLAAAKMAH